MSIHAPTSNHIFAVLELKLKQVVYYHVPTSNHNLVCVVCLDVSSISTLRNKKKIPYPLLVLRSKLWIGHIMLWQSH